jgi:hypothetical protein
MSLAPVIRPEGPAPKRQENLAQGKPWAMFAWPLRDSNLINCSKIQQDL